MATDQNAGDYNVLYTGGPPFNTAVPKVINLGGSVAAPFVTHSQYPLYHQDVIVDRQFYVLIRRADSTLELQFNRDGENIVISAQTLHELMLEYAAKVAE
jgi:hypothetical protein